MSWIDNHCHLDDEADPRAIVEQAHRDGVEQMVCVGVTVPRSRTCIDLAVRIPTLWATAGVHPHDAEGGLDGLEDTIVEGGEAGVLVAVGECGLDYHYDHSPRAVQRSAFATHVGLAHSHDLPLVIHSRQAWDDTFAVLDGEGVPRRTVFHCFTGGPAEAEGVLARGALVSLSGIVTFASATELREVAATAPLGSLMVETDSPYLAPVPHRGKRNEPAHVGLVGAEVARLRGCDVGEVEAATTATAIEFYGLDRRDAPA